MFNRHQVYDSCLLAASRGVNVGILFGNHCGASNKGEFKSEFYQGIAAQYWPEADALGHDECWRLYNESNG